MKTIMKHLKLISPVEHGTSPCIFEILAQLPTFGTSTAETPPLRKSVQTVRRAPIGLDQSLSCHRRGSRLSMASIMAFTGAPSPWLFSKAFSLTQPSVASHQWSVPCKTCRDSSHPSALSTIPLLESLSSVHFRMVRWRESRVGRVQQPGLLICC
jgi:hypothetical protein